jgi:adenylate kinase
MSTLNLTAHFTALTIQKIERNSRSYTLHCEHAVLKTSTTYLIELPGHVVKQLAGQLIQEEGANEQKATNSIVTVSGVAQ